MSVDTVSNTAFAQALATNSKLPSYITAADTLNTANSNVGFIESALDAVNSVGKFAAVSLISGANQLYNTPTSLGNLAGGDYKLSATSDAVNAVSKDLGAFYSDHQESADLVGFIASSLIPGTAGVKVLQAGQAGLRTGIAAGRYSPMMSNALGLLAPNKQALLANAVADVANNRSIASLTQAKNLKVIGAGITQNAYEALAFESAVALTMHDSPVLDNQTMGDFVSNVAWGAGVFGIVGGALDAVKLNYALKNAADDAAVAARPYQFEDAVSTKANVYEQLATDYERLVTIPPVPKDVDPSRAEYLRATAESTVQRIQNRIRTGFNSLAGDDLPVAASLFSALKATDRNTQLGGVIGLAEVTRLGQTSKLSSRFEELYKKAVDGKASAKELDEFMESRVTTKYLKTWGEDAGTLVDRADGRPTNLIDTLKKGESIEVSGRGVKAGKQQFNFDLKPNTVKADKLGKYAETKHWDTLKASPLEQQARYIWASKLPKFEVSPTSVLTVHINDFALMEKVIRDVPAEDLQYVRFLGSKSKGAPAGLESNLVDFLGQRKIDMAMDMLYAGKLKSQDEIAAVLNVRPSFLSGEQFAAPVGQFSVDDIMALQSYSKEYTDKLIKQGDWSERNGLVDVWNVPSTLRLTYDAAPAGVTPLAGINNFVAENMTIIKAQQKLYQEGTDRAVAAGLGAEVFQQLPEITSGVIYSGAKPSGAGHGVLTAAEGNYGSLASLVNFVGSVTFRAINAAKEATRSTMEPLLYKLGNDAEAAIEWSSLMQRVRSIEGDYALNEAGDALEPALLVRWKKAVAEAEAKGPDTPIPKRPNLPNADMPLNIPLQSEAVRKLAAAHIEVNSTRTGKLAGIRSAQGAEFNRSPDVFYPIPPDLRDYKFFALVTDESITSGNHTKTLYAATEQELSDMITKVQANPHLKVRVKQEAEDYFKAQGTWDYEKSLTDNYLNHVQKRTGTSASFLVATDPKKIITDTLNWHLQRDTGLVREAVAAKYEVQFEELRRLGDEYTKVATSKFSRQSIETLADNAAKNPFGDYIKTALAVRKDSSYPWWVNTNRMADEKISAVLNKARELVTSSTASKDLGEVNQLLQQAGYKGAHYDESMEIFANHAPQSGALRAIVQKANSLLATVVLGWDPLNATVNAVSANVLLGAETKAIIRAIQRGDKNAVGALTGLAHIKVPGTDKTMFSAHKLIGNSIAKFASRDAKFAEEMKFYRDNGFQTSLTDQYRDAIDSLTFNGKEGLGKYGERVDSLHAKLKAAGDAGVKYTGNKLAEEFNRFVAADVMKQLTDIAVTHGLMEPKTALAYMNTFVNRTQGNYLAAQRPMMFQGPIGQAIGLFQTYQFNLMQQLLRHVGEGHSKDAMTLLALQGTIHGMNGLPAFNAVNTHLVGTASGNSEHRDFYTETYRATGKEAGDWLMYGAASNALGLLSPELKLNLYTRGDINPRHVTILPSSPADVPIVAATSKFFGNLFATADKLSEGGDISTTLLQGLEHNGISRPLAGLAIALKGTTNVEQASYSTTNAGNVIAANDLLSLTNLVRVVGGKPLDEAVAMDALYRNILYKAKDSDKRTALGAAIKTTMATGADPTQAQIEEFAESYAKAGGRQEEFVNWMSGLYKTANLSQVNAIKNGLESPHSKSMQLIMGGEDLRDFSEE